MTSDPERLLNLDNEAGALERELLASLRSLEPAAGARDHAWKGVARQIALIGAASLVAPSAAAGVKASASLAHQAALLKLLVGLGVGVTGGGAVWYATTTEQAPSAVQAPPSAATATAAPAPVEVAQPESRADIPIAPETNPSPRRAISESERADLLSRESALLVRARAELRSGAVSSAQALLSELETRFPRGMLAQEREVLRIELLAARGDSAGAKRRARAFAVAHPKSPHSAKLARFLGAP